MDYIGEAGIGKSLLVPESQKLSKGLMGMGLFYKNNWPVFNADCGDLDLIGNRKAASYYKNVVWRNSKIELLVHRPIPKGQKEAAAPFGFPDEQKCWTWPGQEGKMMQVNVYSRSKTIRLELNGKAVAEEVIPEGSITAAFQIAYQPGTLVARGFDDGKETGSSTLVTAGKPAAIRLVADRRMITANQNDLSFVSAEIIDDKGNVIPSVEELDIKFQLIGNATIAAVGNGNSSDMSSFQQDHKKVFQGKALAIIRPNGTKGKVVLKATAMGLKDAVIEINMR
jgi:beta-galactosidase